jgi:N-acetylneuraminic acid mutarotase
MGGYDGANNRFLKSCEKYNMLTDEWTPITSMKIARCAFSATSVSDKMAYIFGGYDGTQRLASIERYMPELDSWELLSLTLRFPLSNCACFSPEKGKIVILGGGFSSGFSLAVDMLDIETETWVNLPMMTEGRDLRNKIAQYNGRVYCIGGYNFKAEMFEFQNEEWVELPSYLINDNLDSWSCALMYKTVERRTFRED